MEDIQNYSNVIYSDPNAYALGYRKESKHPSKVVFAEPYESLPPFYIDNGFKKKHCECVPRPINHGKCPKCGNECRLDRTHNPHKYRHPDKKECEHHNDEGEKHQGGMPAFDLKSLMPMLSGLGGGNITNLLGSLGGSGGLGNIMNMLGSGGGKDSGGLGNILSMLGGGGGLGNIMNMFGGKKQQPTKKEAKSSDFPIKDYKRVD